VRVRRVVRARASFITVYGGPAYDQTTQTGYRSPLLGAVPASTPGNGVAVCEALKYTGGTAVGNRAVRWDASGTPATELGNLGTDGSGLTSSGAFGINTAGTAVGYADKYTGGVKLGSRAVRWDATGDAATELGNLGTDSGGSTISIANAINTGGATVGYAEKYVGGADVGPRAVRWDAGGTAATELSNLGTTDFGYTNSVAFGINSSGAAVGYAYKYTGGIDVGSRAVRWDASGAATELGNLGTTINGGTTSQAWAVNAAGTSVGIAQKYNGAADVGTRAVRWDASGTAATELGTLGNDLAGKTTSYAYAINAAGTAVGYADKYVGTDRFTNRNIGPRAVRWGASGTAATELGRLGTDSTGVTSTYASAINAAGIAVGSAQLYTGGTLIGQRAVLWNSDGVALDLNALSDPGSGWTLTEADGISDTNWVTGLGTFDPDGAGPLSAYQRAYLLDVSSAVPEPASFAVLACAARLLMPRRGGRRF
jgi:hypothetical protein